MTGGPSDITVQPIHLGRGATAQSEPAFTGDMAWYEGYEKRHRDDGAEGRLVTMQTFASPWDAWEVHPNGSEVVLCIDGTITLHQEKPDGTGSSVTLGAGEYAVNDPGVWHTADVRSSATVLFITAGTGTEHRPR